MTEAIAAPAVFKNLPFLLTRLILANSEPSNPDENGKIKCEKTGKIRSSEEESLRYTQSVTTVPITAMNIAANPEETFCNRIQQFNRQ